MNIKKLLRSPYFADADPGRCLRARKFFKENEDATRFCDPFNDDEIFRFCVKKCEDCGELFTTRSYAHDLANAMEARLCEPCMFARREEFKYLAFDIEECEKCGETFVVRSCDDFSHEC